MPHIDRTECRHHVDYFQRLDEKLCRGFTEEEMEQLLRYLQRIIQNLDGEDL